MSEFEVVDKASLPSVARGPIGMFARMFIAMQGLSEKKALAVPTKDGAHGAHIKRNLVRIASREGKKVMWRREADFSKYYFWLEDEGK